MRWNYTDQEITAVQCTNPFTGKHILRLSPNSRNTEGYSFFTEEDGGEQKPVVRYVSMKVKSRPGVAELVEIVDGLQNEYDKSPEVDVFYIDGRRCWLGKETRVGLFSLLNIERDAGKERTTIWFDGHPVEMSVVQALEILGAVELYAKQCLDNTQRKLAEIAALSTVEECLTYDITSGYPEPLRFETLEIVEEETE